MHNLLVIATIQISQPSVTKMMFCNTAGKMKPSFVIAKRSLRYIFVMALLAEKQSTIKERKKAIA